MRQVRIEPHRPPGWTGEWPPPFYPELVEEICTLELKFVDLYPDEPRPIRIDRYIEKRFDIEVESIPDLPVKHPGLTIFKEGRPYRIIIDRKFDEGDDVQVLRRARATMAHEAGHALLHGPFFDETPSDETEAVYSPSFEASFGRVATSGDANHVWLEWQANYAMASLLMPGELVRRALASYLVPESTAHVGRPGPFLDVSRFRSAVEDLVDLFDVNFSMARIRLKSVFPWGTRTYPHRRYNEPAEPSAMDLRYEQAAVCGVSHWSAYQKALFPAPAKTGADEDPEARRLDRYWRMKEWEREEELRAAHKKLERLQRSIKRSSPLVQMKLTDK